MMAMAILEESQSGEEKQADALRLMEIISVIRKSQTVIYCVLTICQVITSFIFYSRSKKIKELNWLPKFIMLLINLEGILVGSYYFAVIFFQINFSTMTSFVLFIISTITTPVI